MKRILYCILLLNFFIAFQSCEDEKTIEITELPNLQIGAITNGMTDVALQPVIDWAVSEIPEGVSLSCELFLGKAADQLSSIATVQLEDGKLSYSITISTALEPATQYFWQVKLQDKSGEVKLSSVWSFTTKAAPEGFQNIWMEDVDDGKLMAWQIENPDEVETVDVKRPGGFNNDPNDEIHTFSPTGKGNFFLPESFVPFTITGCDYFVDWGGSYFVRVTMKDGTQTDFVEVKDEQLPPAVTQFYTEGNVLAWRVGETGGMDGFNHQQGFELTINGTSQQIDKRWEAITQEYLGDESVYRMQLSETAITSASIRTYDWTGNFSAETQIDLTKTFTVEFLLSGATDGTVSLSLKSGGTSVEQNIVSGKATFSQVLPGEYSYAVTGMTGYEDVVATDLSIAEDSEENPIQVTVSLVSDGEKIYEGNMRLETQEQVNSFGGYTRINGDLQIGEYRADITDLSPLQTLTHVEGNLTFEDCEDLTSLSGLQNLVSVGGLAVWDTNELPSLSGLDNLETITGDFKLQRCDKLWDLSAISKITAIGGSIDIGILKLNSMQGFQNVTSVGQDLIVIANCPDFSALSGITSVPGTFQISQNNLITDLSDFSNLQSVGNLVVTLNDNITSLTGLENLSLISDEDVSIGNNPKLVSLAALSGLTNIPDELRLMTLPALTSFAGLDNITAAGTSVIIQGTGATDLSGLGSLQSIGDYISIGDNANMTSFNGLSALSSVKSVTVSENDQLTSLSGLPSLTTVEYLNIQNNDGLTNLEGLDNIQSVTGGLVISYNSNLQTLVGLSGLTSVARHDGYSCSLDIKNNPLLQNLNGLSSVTTVQQLEIEGNASLTSLAGIETLSTSTFIQIKYNNQLTDISALSNVSTFEMDGTLGSISIQENATLPSLNGLQNITKVKNLTVERNPLLADLQGLSGLTSIANDTKIVQNNALTNLSGLSNVTELGTDMFCSVSINDNENLQSLNGLQGITTTEASVSITSNESLTSLVGFENLTSVKKLVIDGNTSLTNLDDLHSLVTISGELLIYSNAALTNLDGLSNLNEAYEVTIGVRYGSADYGNKALTDFCGLKKLVNSGNISADGVDIQFNAANPTFAEIQACE